MVSDYQAELRERFLGAAVTPPPAPWRPAFGRIATAPIGGLVGVGIAPHPKDGRDLVFVTSHQGRGLFDPLVGDRIARDRDADAELVYPDDADLTCPGLGVLEGTRIAVAGLQGGGLRTTGVLGWTIDVVAPGWPDDRVLLWHGRLGPYGGTLGEDWWAVYDTRGGGELRAAGFSPSGRTLVVATSSDVAIWTAQGA
ncbi:hypothetical protein [Yinghuangia soli]|uniref:Uncharacterized protein n=1 Tax=Yinghuangia soli TaxID=2908204 RepID=A0AA41PX70_9ACTN|nr:hypothetical protein [Yinghuangia soli]MCF2527351.1 hypothetical protein [Yinghuangia soli]